MQAWKNALKSEFARARAARSRGNEGQARVCARRAAGIAIREYLYRQGVQPGTTSAMDLMGALEQDPATPAELREILAYLSMPVDRNFQLPAEIDLIAEAEQLCALLLPEWSD